MLNKNDFYFEIFHFNKLPIFYSTLINTLTNDVLISSENEESSKEIEGVNLISDVPSYLKAIKSTKKNKLIKSVSVKQHKGLLLDFRKYNDFNSFLKLHFGSRNRQLLRRSNKAFHSCFDISQKVYFGEITQKEYENIFSRFYVILEKRSIEKNIDNLNLKRWDYFTNLVYPMILDKTASLFVIYDGNTPIAISLNFHLNDVVFPHIVTYDVDYSKFRIGHIIWLNLIEWLFENNVVILDLSKGNYPYLKRLSNSSYQMVYQVFYKSNDIFSFVNVLLICSKLKFKQFVRDKNIHVLARNIIDRFFKTPNDISYSILKYSDKINEKKLEKININNIKYPFLKRSVCDILYKTYEKIENVNIYKTFDSDDVFFYKGQKEIFMITKNK